MATNTSTTSSQYAPTCAESNDSCKSRHRRNREMHTVWLLPSNMHQHMLCQVSFAIRGVIAIAKNIGPASFPCVSTCGLSGCISEPKRNRTPRTNPCTTSSQYAPTCAESNGLFKSRHRRNREMNTGMASEGRLNWCALRFRQSLDSADLSLLPHTITSSYPLSPFGNLTFPD